MPRRTPKRSNPETLVLAGWLEETGPYLSLREEPATGRVTRTVPDEPATAGLGLRSS